MRVIEKKMLKAVSEKKVFNLANTAVLVNNNGVFVRLYNTIIFARVNGVDYYSDGGYNTVTTGSRLRALGANYSTNYKNNNCTLQNSNNMYNLYWYGKLN